MICCINWSSDVSFSQTCYSLTVLCKFFYMSRVIGNIGMATLWGWLLRPTGIVRYNLLITVTSCPRYIVLVFLWANGIFYQLAIVTLRPFLKTVFFQIGDYYERCNELWNVISGFPRKSF